MTVSSVFHGPAPQYENICAVVVSFCPDGDLLCRLRAIKAQMASLIVVDNGSFGESVAHLRAAELELGIEVVRNGSNMGIAAALNRGARLAGERGFAWILTMDQDTVAGEELVRTQLRVYEDFPEKDMLAVIGSNYSNPVSGGEFASSQVPEDRSWLEAKAVITSGSLISIAAFHEIGPFREELFLDCVDFEYCLRARSKGFRVILATKAVMQHPIGAVTLHRLPWKTTTTTNHSPLRRYYMARNQIILAREYLPKEPRWILSMLYRWLKAILLMCLFEERVGPKLRNTVVGVFDGFLSNYSRDLVVDGGVSKS
jgi:rhamnosyltransferase